MICNYGCGREATHQFKNGKWCCKTTVNSCIAFRIKCGNIRKGRLVWNKGKKASNETKLKQSLVRKGVKKPPRTEEHKRKLSESNKGKIISKEQIDRHRLKIIDLWKNPNSKYNSKEFRSKIRQHMIDGNALKMIKAIKKISNEEIKLRNIVKELYSNIEFQHPVFNYSLDIALPDKKIAIEYDGYYHFDTEEHKQYHKLRQEKIEKEGWKFLRYTMFDKFPTLEKVKRDIEKIERVMINGE